MFSNMAMSMLPTTLLLLLVAEAQAASLCFFPGGIQARDVPCDPTAEVSMCCGSVAACLSNGLCKDTSTTNITGVSYARGTCSDPTWQSPICPQNCQLNQDTAQDNLAFDFRFNGVQVWQCNARGFAMPADYCCESDSEKSRCCSTETALFALRAATLGNALPVQGQDITVVVSTTTTLQLGATNPTTALTDGIASISASVTQQPSLPAATAQPTNTRPTLTSASMTGTVAGGGAFTPTSGSSSSATEATLSAAVSSTKSTSTLSTGGIVAVGVSASVGSAAVVSAVVFFFLKWRDRRRGDSDSGFIYSHNPTVDMRYGGAARPVVAELDMRGIDLVRYEGMRSDTSPALSEMDTQGISPVSITRSERQRQQSRLYEME